MQAIRFHQHGGPEVLRLEDIPKALAKPGETLVRVTAAGVNYTDIYQREGLTPTPLPFTPGLEGCGIVCAAGGALPEGTRVAWAPHPGAYAEYAAIPDWKLVAVPDAIDDASAAATLMQAMTAHYLCENTFPLRAGDVALVHAGAGGVGLLLIQMLKHKAATVLSTVSTPEKAALARAMGADAAILYTQVDFAAAVREARGGRGAHVVYDSVGKDTYRGSLACVRPLGMLVLYGQSSGLVPPLDVLELTARGSVTLARPALTHHVADRDSMRERAARVFEQVGNGQLQLRLGRRYGLAEAARAQTDLASRASGGKLLIDIGA